MNRWQQNQGHLLAIVPFQALERHTRNSQFPIGIFPMGYSFSVLHWYISYAEVVRCTIPLANMASQPRAHLS